MDTSSVGNTTYAALHPEVEGLNPEEYPDINKLGILADVAPYSREYNRIRAVVDKQSHGDLELRSRYEQIVEQVRQTKESRTHKTHLARPPATPRLSFPARPPQAAHQSPPQRSPAGFQSSCLLLAKMQVIANSEGGSAGVKKGLKLPPGRPSQAAGRSWFKLAEFIPKDAPATEQTAA